MKISKLYKKNKTRIYTGVGVGLLISSNIATAIATYKNSDNIYRLKKAYTKGFLTKKEYIIALLTIPGKYYIPSIGSILLGSGLVISSDKKEAAKYAALTTLYDHKDLYVKKLKDSIQQQYGKNKLKKLNDDIASKELTNDIPNNVIVCNNDKSSIFYETFSGRYFNIEIEKFKQIVNNVNYRLMNEMFISINDLYYELGLPAVDSGNLIGFNVDNGLIEYTMSAQVRDDKAVLVVSFDNLINER